MSDEQPEDAAHLQQEMAALEAKLEQLQHPDQPEATAVPITPEPLAAGAPVTWKRVQYSYQRDVPEPVWANDQSWFSGSERTLSADQAAALVALPGFSVVAEVDGP